MYWLIASLIIAAMMGVLAVADSRSMPISPSLLHITSTPILFLSLILLSVILMALLRFTIPSVSTAKISTSAISNSDTAQSSTGGPSDRFKRISRIVTYLLVAMLASALMIGSALQAMGSHQQAAATQVTEPMRVQALVTIEGISDSVYDTATESGYRQVVTISQISPLVSDLTAQDLDKITDKYVINKNSLNDDVSKQHFAHTNSRAAYQKSNEDTTYRILLNAYPKTASKSSLGKLSDDHQLTRLNLLKPGDQLLMSLALAPLATSEQAINSPSGFDSHRWLKARHIDGVANVLATSTLTVSDASSAVAAYSDNSYLQRFRTRIDQGRWQLRQHFYEEWVGLTETEQQAKAVTLSLLTGDRSLISRDTKDLYQLAGISHLLAISGTHVLFLAIVLSGTVVFIFDRQYPMMYRSVPRWQVRWWVMVGAAFVYALFTGFDIPAARTAWMLLALGVTRLTLLPISTTRVLCALAVLMAWHDPYVLWQAGYWLSFIAVALLLKYDDTSHKHAQSDKTQKIYSVEAVFGHVWSISKRLFKLQFWLFITLLPITLLLFGKASLWGLVVNLFAIGLFGWVIVPLNLLAGLCYLLSPTIADGIWAFVAIVVAHLHECIIWLTSLPSLSKAWLYTPVNTAILFIVLLSMLPWLLPRGFISRWLAIPPLALLMMTVYANQQSLRTTPTLYVLPTGDRYVSAALLQYPIEDSKTDDKTTHISWLLLADHRSGTRTLPSTLTIDKLYGALAQQLGSLSVDTLEGIIVQSGYAGLTTTLTHDDKHASSAVSTPELLPMTVARLAGHIPISQYWQAGRSDRLRGLQQASQTSKHIKDKLGVSVQPCEQGKTWQLPNGQLTIQALTGWSEIGDESVWDCTVAIDTRVPLQVLKYNASNPLKSLPANAQTRLSNPSTTRPVKNLSSRLILNADTHPRLWQMWSLLCAADAHSQTLLPTTWLGHSESHITTDVLSHQNTHQIMTYDDKGLEAALSLAKIGEASPQK